MLKSAVHTALAVSKITEKKGVSAAPSHVEDTDGELGNSTVFCVCSVKSLHLLQKP